MNNKNEVRISEKKLKRSGSFLSKKIRLIENDLHKWCKENDFLYDIDVLLMRVQGDAELKGDNGEAIREFPLYFVIIIKNQTDEEECQNLFTKSCELLEKHIEDIVHKDLLIEEKDGNLWYYHPIIFSDKI